VASSRPGALPGGAGGIIITEFTASAVNLPLRDVGMAANDDAPIATNDNDLTPLLMLAAETR